MYKKTNSMLNIVTNKNQLLLRTFANFAIVNCLIGFAFLRINSNYKWILFISINVLLTLSILIRGYLDSVSLCENQKKLKLIYKNWIKIIRVREYPIDMISFTYKKESISYRSGSGKTLKLYINKKRVLKLRLDYDGWTEDKLDELVKNFNNLGIPRKFIGYTLKDEYPI
jgi:hypothetical protein